MTWTSCPGKGWKKTKTPDPGQRGFTLVELIVFDFGLSELHPGFVQAAPENHRIEQKQLLTFRDVVAFFYFYLVYLSFYFGLDVIRLAIRLELTGAAGDDVHRGEGRPEEDDQDQDSQPVARSAS